MNPAKLDIGQKSQNCLFHELTVVVELKFSWKKAEDEIYLSIGLFKNSEVCTTQFFQNFTSFFEQMFLQEFEIKCSTEMKPKI